MTADALTEIARRSASRLAFGLNLHIPDDGGPYAYARWASTDGRNQAGAFDPAGFRVDNASFNWQLPYLGEGIVLPTLEVSLAATESGASSWQWLDADSDLSAQRITGLRALPFGRIRLPSGAFEDVTLAVDVIAGYGLPVQRIDLNGVPARIDVSAETWFSTRLQRTFTGYWAYLNPPFGDPTAWGNRMEYALMEVGRESTIGAGSGSAVISWDITTLADLSAAMAGRNLTVAPGFSAGQNALAAAGDFARMACCSPYIDGRGILTWFSWASDATPVADWTLSETDIGWDSARLTPRFDRVSTDTLIRISNSLTAYSRTLEWIQPGISSYYPRRDPKVISFDYFDLSDAIADPTWIRDTYARVFHGGDATQGWQPPTQFFCEVPFKVGLQAELADLVNVSFPRLGVENRIFRIEAIRLNLRSWTFELTMHDRVTFPDLTP